MSDYTGLIVLSWLASIILAGIVGHEKEGVAGGALLGLFFGPLGVLAALGIDMRCECIHCCGRLNTNRRKPDICPHCQSKLYWLPGFAGGQTTEEKFMEYKKQELAKKQKAEEENARKESERLEKQKQRQANADPKKGLVRVELPGGRVEYKKQA